MAGEQRAQGQVVRHEECGIRSFNLREQQLISLKKKASWGQRVTGDEIRERGRMRQGLKNGRPWRKSSVHFSSWEKRILCKS